MTDEELLKTPLAQLTREQVLLAIAAKDRQCRKIEEENKSFVKSPFKRVYCISDHLGEGVQGVVNPGTGTRHDSKSAYRKELKAHGLIELGSDAKAEVRKEIRGDYDYRKDIAKAMDQTGFMEKLQKAGSRARREAILTGRD